MTIKSLLDQLLFEEEGNTLDFKAEQYPFAGAPDDEKAELLKDILTFANAWRRADAYILIGVKEIKGGRSEVLGISTFLDDAHLQQFVNSKTQRPIDFSYKTVPFEGVHLGVIHIPVQRRPFYLKKDFGGLKKEQVYVRRGSSTALASLDEVSTMGTGTGGYEETPNLDVYLVSGKHDEIIEKRIDFKVTSVRIPEDDEFPDYGRQAIWSHGLAMPSLYGKNENYYRENAKYLQAKLRVRAFKLAVRNTGTIPARDVKVTFDVASDGNTTIAIHLDDMPDKPQQEAFSSLAIRRGIMGPPADVVVKNTLEGWRITCHLGKVQPKDTVITGDSFCLGATTSKLIRLNAQVFSDDLPEPKKDTLDLGLEVEERVLTVANFLQKDNG